MSDHLISRSRFLDALVLDADNKTDLIQVHQALEKAVISPDDVRGAGEWEEIEVMPKAYDICGVETWASKMQCCNCGFTTFAIGGHFSQYNYCPSCGAKMEVSEDA